jgi:hypothetical protein
MKKNFRKMLPRKFAVFSSFEDENNAECKRFARMTPTQRLDEFAILQERVWGEKWTREPMRRIASIEKVSW